MRANALCTATVSLLAALWARPCLGEGAAAPDETPKLPELIQKASTRQSSVFSGLKPGQSVDAPGTGAIGTYPIATATIRRALRGQDRALAVVGDLDASELQSHEQAIRSALAGTLLGQTCTAPDWKSLEAAALCADTPASAVNHWLDSWLENLRSAQAPLEKTSSLDRAAIYAAVTCAGNPDKCDIPEAVHSVFRPADPSVADGTVASVVAAARTLLNFDAARGGGAWSLLHDLATELVSAPAPPKRNDRRIVLAYIDDDIPALLAEAGIEGDGARLLRLALSGRSDALSQWEDEAAPSSCLALALGARVGAAFNQGALATIAPELVVRLGIVRLAASPVDALAPLFVRQGAQKDLKKDLMSPSVSVLAPIRRSSPWYLGWGAVGGFNRVWDGADGWYAGLVVEGAAELDVDGR